VAVTVGLGRYLLFGAGLQPTCLALSGRSSLLQPVGLVLLPPLGSVGNAGENRTLGTSGNLGVGAVTIV
jgi:hypothetical protein